MLAAATLIGGPAWAQDGEPVDLLVLTNEQAFDTGNGGPFITARPANGGIQVLIAQTGSEELAAVFECIAGDTSCTLELGGAGDQVASLAREGAEGGQEQAILGIDGGALAVLAQFRSEPAGPEE